MDYAYDDSGVRINLLSNSKNEDVCVGIIKRNSEEKICLQKLAKNSDVTVELLEELKQYNAKVIEKLVSIHRTLNDLFNLSELKADENTERYKEAVEISKKLEAAIKQKEKFDIRNFLENISITAFFMGLEMYLKKIGIIN